MKRSRIRPVSEDRLAEAEERRAVVERAKARARYRCGLEWLGGCFGDLVGHELAHRSVYPGSHLIDDLVVAVCVGHNGWEDVQVQSVAEAAGVRVSAWVVDRFGTARVRDECQRIRDARRTGRDPGPALWTLEGDAPPIEEGPERPLVVAIVVVDGTLDLDALFSESPDPF